ILIPRLSGTEKSVITESEYGGLKIFNATLNANKLSRLLWLYSHKNVLEAFDFKIYDVISVHIVSHGILPSIQKNCKKHGIPVIQHFHGLNVWQDYHGNNSILHRALIKRNAALRYKHLKSCSAIVGVSNKVCDVVRERLDSVPLFTVYNGVDLARFSADNKVKNKIFTVICVANLILIKGHDYLIEAVAKIKAEGTAIRLQLVGAGPEETRLKEKCASLGVADSVEFLGWQEYDTVAHLMKNADMFVMPSYFEALGCVYLEAMSAGTLTCGCFGTGAEEIIDHERNGLLANKRSADDIYSLIRFAIDNPGKALEIAENGIVRASEFSWDASARALEKVYDTVKKSVKEI
ncbi:MAG: glycosyltransferase family 4 protein, partial [Clostridia bacterium]|nr:glycosyltransferase family 4 protein [Clostridia bacterium]